MEFNSGNDVFFEAFKKSGHYNMLCDEINSESSFRHKMYMAAKGQLKKKMGNWIA